MSRHSLGTWTWDIWAPYSADRQAALDELFISAAETWEAGRFALAGAQYPDRLPMPPNVERIIHLPPAAHRRFCNRQRFTLNITRQDMIAAGYSPSVRLFETAACGIPIISDSWPGLETILTPGSEILTAASGAEVVELLRDLPEAERVAIGERARRRVLHSHTAAHRAIELERYVADVHGAERCLLPA